MLMSRAYEDYEWYLDQDLRKYSGEWVAIMDKQVISHNKDAGEVIKDSKKRFPKRTPFIAKVNSHLRIRKCH